MSRLLFAAARGARIEFVITTISDWQRIHPDDAHLQYGPISTALREMAINDLWTSKCWEWILASSAADEFNDCYDRYDRHQCEPDYPLFYLFLAEFLADEGM